MSATVLLAFIVRLSPLAVVIWCPFRVLLETTAGSAVGNGGGKKVRKRIQGVNDN